MCARSRLAARAQCFLRALALRQIEHESDTLISAFFEAAEPISTGTRLPSLRKYSFS